MRAHLCYPLCINLLLPTQTLTGMKRKILIVEDLFVEANHLRILLRKTGYEVTGIARTYEQAEALIRQDPPDIVLLDIFLAGKKTGIDLAKILGNQQIPFVYLSANSNEEVLKKAKATKPSGFIVKPFREKDLLIALEIAEYLNENSNDSQAKKENAFQLEVKKISEQDSIWPERLLGIVKAFQKILPFDYMAAGFLGNKFHPSNSFHFLRVGFDEYQAMDLDGVRIVSNITVHEIETMLANTNLSPDIIFYNEKDFEKLASVNSMRRLIGDKFGMTSLFSFPLPSISAEGKKFFFAFYSRRSDTYDESHVELCERIQGSLERMIRTIIQNKSSDFSQVRLDNSIEIKSNQNKNGHQFEEIVGHSHLLLNVFDLINQVASSDTSVLITGESGTGKERVADAIHALSSRSDKPFIKVNCAALPINLIESELFGHEKGSFTGAIAKRIGRFEQANGGTIFLDEIGDMPIEIQIKLLRVLQQREIERIGSVQSTKIDIRIIAATNRDLEKAIAEGKFRLDLYYRLNIFPIPMPALRHRLEDIEPLTNHFLKYFSRKTGRQIEKISDNAMKSLMCYNWPGNIRELENVIERSVLLAKGATIDHILLPNQNNNNSAATHEKLLKTIEENERDHIIAVLKACNGKVSGKNGAAEILAIPSTTLGSRMKKLGIKRQFSF